MTFLGHMIVSALIGAFLWIIPGRTLDALGWLPNDPIMTRLMGAAMLALAWSSFRGWRAIEYQQVAILVELEVILTVTAVLAWARHLVEAYYPWIAYFSVGVYAIFAVLWIINWIKRPK
jgi:hypothetical protein